MSPRALITGATGFVGSHVAESFVEAGHEVLCGVRATSDLRWISHLPVEIVPLDLQDPQNLSAAVENVGVVVHAAGLTRALKPDDYHAVNTTGTRNLATAAAGIGVRRFIFISSLEARGPDELAADGRDHPASPYGQSKLEAERFLHNLDGEMDVVALRLAAVYGPRDADILPFFQMARRGFLVHPSGAGPLQPVYAADAARVVLAAARGNPGFGPFPVAEPARYTWPSIAAAIGGAVGRPVRPLGLPAGLFPLAGRAAELLAKPFGSAPLFDERRARDLAAHTWTCEVSGTEKALGWKAEVSLAEGAERTARWYKGVGWL